jgi:hypothetical protein
MTVGEAVMAAYQFTIIEYEEPGGTAQLKCGRLNGPWSGSHGPGNPKSVGTDLGPGRTAM